VLGIIQALIAGSKAVWAHPDCAARYNETLNAAFRIENGERDVDLKHHRADEAASKKAMRTSYYEDKGDDPSRSGSFVCAIGRGTHIVDHDNPATRVQSTSVSGRQDRVCDSCRDSLTAYVGQCHLWT